MKNRNISRE